MKLLVVVLCLLSERYLIHQAASYRFIWLDNYVALLKNKTQGVDLLNNHWIFLALLILPLAFITWVVLYLLSGWIYGFTGFLLNLAIFYYCLGPQNVFYPTTSKRKSKSQEMGNYFNAANTQLFAVLFWYILAGPVGAVVYRLLSLLESCDRVENEARLLTDILEWIPARIAAMLYLLVGNFQTGLTYFARGMLDTPSNNGEFLKQCGMGALGEKETTKASVAEAELLVEHAIILSLVLLALFTLASWL